VYAYVGVCACLSSMCIYLRICIYTYTCTHITYTCDWDALKMGLGIFRTNTDSH